MSRSSSTGGGRSVQGEQYSPQHVTRNPNHRVPVLEHDGFTLWESFAIMQYLADGTPGQTLYPAERRERRMSIAGCFGARSTWRRGSPF
ncbi:MAG: glutathione S-transferase family protein [Burkholderiaceae bacterium]